MKLSLKRLFGRSMTGGLDLAEAPTPPSPRSAARKTALVSLALVLAIVGALAGGYYFAMRPVTLKIAVGPANSDDLKVVQALTQAFAQHKSYVRLRPIQTDGATASADALAEGKADLAIVRGDLDVPKNAQAVATLRKNVAVLWVRARQGQEEGAPKITKIAQLAGHRIGVVGRTQANVNLLKVILQQYGVDPAKVEIIQFPANEAAEAIKRPEGRRLSRGRPRQQQDHGRRDRGFGQGRRHADLPRDRFRGRDRAEPSGLRSVGNSRRHLWRLARPAR